MCSNKIIVAIDGYSSCGKSTMAKWLAKQIGYIYVDTGAMYRMVTLFALRNKFITSEVIDEEGLKNAIKDIKISFVLNRETNLPMACLDGKVVETEIRLMEVSNNVSPIAALPFVREMLTVQQKKMGEQKGIVMDGRDIGTAVFPNAELKIFVTASAEIRAKRRYDELVGKGEAGINFDEILKNVQERDYIDSHRELNPLRQAEDAVVLDNSYMMRDEQNVWLLEKFEKAIQTKNAVRMGHIQ